MSGTKNKIRLFIDQELVVGQKIVLPEAASHYLCNVMRREAGEIISCFNGKAGEFDCFLQQPHKKQAVIEVQGRTREFCPPTDLWLLFAPLKKDQTDFVIEKATELGAAKIVPVITAYTMSDKVRVERFQAQAVEAAEQCRRVEVPEVSTSVKLEKLLENWDDSRRLYLMDETGKGKPAAETFASHAGEAAAILTGPEGGFTEAEIAMLYQKPFVQGISLGQRILRAETAAAAALAVWQAVAGDWKAKD